MSMTVCPYCGKDNPDTCLDCRHCGRVLPSRVVEKPSRLPGVGTALRLLVFLVLLSSLILALMSSPAPGVIALDANVSNFYRELVAMEHAVRRGNENYWTVPEGAANAYLAAVIERHDKESSDEAWRRLVFAQVDFRSAVVRLTLHHQWGPITLSQQLDLKPVESPEGGIGWTLTSFQVGRLPIPPMLRDQAARAVYRAFTAFERDLYILQGVTELHFDNEKAYLVNRRKSV